jgi:hypothetical protein
MYGRPDTPECGSARPQPCVASAPGHAWRQWRRPGSDGPRCDARATSVVTPRLGNDYDPRPHEDQARRHIAYLLIGLLWTVVAALLILVAWGGIQVQDIKKLAVLLGPVVTLASAATGFYYGTQSR